MAKNKYIGVIPGNIKNGDDTRTDVLTLLGLDGKLDPLDIGNYNDGRNDPPVAAVEVDGKQYGLNGILEHIGNASTGAVSVEEPEAGTTFTLEPCPVTYDFGERAELTLTLTKTTQYHFMFTCPDDAATVLTMAGIKVMGDTLAAGKTYEVDVWAGIARISEVDAE